MQTQSITTHESKQQTYRLASAIRPFTDATYTQYMLIAYNIESDNLIFIAGATTDVPRKLSALQRSPQQRNFSIGDTVRALTTVKTTKPRPEGLRQRNK